MKHSKRSRKNRPTKRHRQTKRHRPTKRNRPTKINNIHSGGGKSTIDEAVKTLTFYYEQGFIASNKPYNHSNYNIYYDFGNNEYGKYSIRRKV